MTNSSLTSWPFNFQACRGNMLDPGVQIPILASDETDAGRRPSYEVRPCPLYKDSLIMYATPPGNSSNGSSPFSEDGNI